MENDQDLLNFLYFINLHIRKLRVETSTIDILFLACVVETESLRQGVNKKKRREGREGEETILNYHSCPVTGK